MDSIPIRIHTPDAVFTETYGLLGLQEGCLVLEYETKDAFIGAYNSGVEELEMLPDDVSALRRRVCACLRAGVEVEEAIEASIL